MKEINTVARQRHEHEELCQLIPWYVNGTLSKAEHRRVQEHLDTCLACRSELNLQREIAQVIAEEDTEREALSYNIVKLRQRISVDSVANTSQYAPHSELIGERGSPSPRKSFCHVIVAVAAVIATAAVGLGLFWQVIVDDTLYSSPDYRTLSSPDTGAVASGSDLFLVFESGIADIEMSETFRRYGLEPVTWSEDQRLWRVRLPQDERDGDGVSAALAGLRHDENILFVERVLTGE